MSEKMNAAQEAHLAAIQHRVKERLDRKYRIGQKEHGGNLFDKPALLNLSEEVTDLVTYLHTVEDHVVEAQGIVADIKGLWQHGNLATARDLLDLLDSKLRDL